MADTKTIAILAASQDELKLIKKEALAMRPYEGFRIIFLETGNEAKNIVLRILALLDSCKIDFAILIGFAGALVDKIKAGDIIVPLKFLSLGLKEEYYPHQGLISLVREVKENKKFNVYFSINLAVDRICFQADKTRLAQTNSEVSSLDIEAFTVAKMLSQKEVPFLAIKGISDELDFCFKDFSFLFNSEYELSLMKLFLYCLRYPQEIPNLYFFLQDCRSAAKNNLEFLRDFLSHAISFQNSRS